MESHVGGPGDRGLLPVTPEAAGATVMTGAAAAEVVKVASACRWGRCPRRPWNPRGSDTGFPTRGP